MRLSDLVAAVALVFAIIASLYFSRRSKSQMSAPKLNTQVKIAPVIDKKRKKTATADDPAASAYQGTLIVNQGRLELHSAHFHVRRKTHDEYVEIHVFAGAFDQDRQRPVVESGHKINASPANPQGFSSALEGAEAIHVEFWTVTGQIFRSPDLSVGRRAA